MSKRNTAKLAPSQPRFFIRQRLQVGPHSVTKGSRLSPLGRATTPHAELWYSGPAVTLVTLGDQCWAGEVGMWISVSVGGDRDIFWGLSWSCLPERGRGTPGQLDCPLQAPVWEAVGRCPAGPRKARSPSGGATCIVTHGGHRTRTRKQPQDPELPVSSPLPQSHIEVQL